MKEKLSFRNIFLFLLTLVVYWSVDQIMILKEKNFVYAPNTDSGYFIIKTEFGGFPVVIDDSKTSNGATDLTLSLVNPLNIRFREAELSVQVNDTIETIRMDIIPGRNKTKMKISPIERGQPLMFSLKLDKIIF